MITFRSSLGSTATLLAVVAATACGDVYAEPEGESIPVPRSEATAVLPPDVPVVCPAERPTENTPCAVEGSTCEFGASPDMQCNETFACTADVSDNFWHERPTDRCHRAACPAEPADVESIDGQPCALPEGDAGPTSDADEAVCAMSNGTCACTTGPDAAHAHERRWVCIRPSLGGCPVDRPRAGERCSGSLWCDYGSCKWKRGILMQCKDGVFLTGGAPCN